MLPHEQKTSSSTATRIWPMSPAAPSAPRCTSPSAMMPHPMPVATLTKRTCSLTSPRDQYSPRPMTFTSLSTRIGTSKCSESKSGTTTPSHPGMIGGRTTVPVANSTGPGTPIPMALTSSGARPLALSISPKRSISVARTRSGPSAMSSSVPPSASGCPLSVVMARRACVAPMSAAKTTPAAGLRVSRVGRRPPVDGPSPASTSTPRSSSSSTRCEMVDRANPVILASSARVEVCCWTTMETSLPSSSQGRSSLLTDANIPAL